MKEWVRMSSYWLLNEDRPPLASLRWFGPQKSDQIAGLMIYMALVHHANDQPTAKFGERGWTALTYTRLGDITGLSRSKISGGLSVLQKLGAIEICRNGRSNSYHVVDYGQSGGWAKLPARGLYSRDLQRIPAFHALKLRSRVELNALKIYLLIIALRDNSTNYAVVSYDRIRDYTGINRIDIKSALSLLVTQGMIQVDQGATALNQFSTMNMYRPKYLEPYKHRGTNGRGLVGVAS